MNFLLLYNFSIIAGDTEEKNDKQEDTFDQTRGLYITLRNKLDESSGGQRLGEIVLFAPDIDSDSFRMAWPDIQHISRRTTLYVSKNDKALKLSREVHGYPRLGEAGEYLMVLPGLDTINVSLTDNKRPSGHLYHLYNPEVVRDITILLNIGMNADKRPTLRPADMNGSAFWQVIPEER